MKIYDTNIWVLTDKEAKALTTLIGHTSINSRIEMGMPDEESRELAEVFIELETRYGYYKEEKSL